MHTIKLILESFQHIEDLFLQQEYAKIVEKINLSENLICNLDWLDMNKNFTRRLVSYRQKLEDSLDSLLNRNSLFYDQEVYSEIQLIFTSLHTTEENISSQLILNYKTSWQQRSINTIKNTYLEFNDELKADEMGSIDQSQTGASFYQILNQCFIATRSEDTLKILFTNLIENAIRIIHSLTSVILWHQDRQSGSTFDRNIFKALTDSSVIIWKDIFDRIDFFIKFLVDKCNVLSFETAISILHILKVMSKIGGYFNSTTDFNHLDALTSSMFNNLHQKQKERLPMFLEVENWARCPLDEEFSVLEFNEYKFLIQTEFNSLGICQKLLNQKIIGITEEVLQKLNLQPLSQMESINLTKEYMTDFSKEHKPSASILSSSCLEVLRILGRYLELAHNYESLKEKIHQKIMHLIVYYIHCIISQKKDAYSEERSANEILGGLLDEKITSSQTFYDISMKGNWTTEEAGVTFPMWTKSLSQMIVCLESIRYLKSYANKVILPVLSNKTEMKLDIGLVEKHITREWSQRFIEAIFQHTGIAKSSVIEEISNVYEMIESNNTYIVNNNCPSSPTQWVIILISKAINPLKSFLFPHETFTKSINTIPLINDMYSTMCHEMDSARSPPVLQTICRSFREIVSDYFYKAITNVTKCTQDGRDQMIIDLQTIFVNFESFNIDDDEGFPRIEIISEYIQAFHLPLKDWEEWLNSEQVFPNGHKAPPNYSERELINLAKCVSSGDLKILNYLQSMINEHF